MTKDHPPIDQIASPGSRSWGVSEGWSHAASRASLASSSSSSSDTLSVGSWEDLAWQPPMQPSQAFHGQALTGHSLRALDFLAMPGMHKRSEKNRSQQGSTDHTEKVGLLFQDSQDDGQRGKTQPMTLSARETGTVRSGALLSRTAISRLSRRRQFPEMLDALGEGIKERRLIGELTQHGQRLRVAKGGKGGKGNESFKTHRNTAPFFCTHGTPGLTGR
eukprot:s4451_g3.t2